ncbi:unnamed protein product [Auanema sp. JU1783]|nr:unnamed protein product [Auanema sp. JU1783]
MSNNRDAIKVEPIKAGNQSEIEEMAHLAAQGGDGRLFKMEIDYTTQVDEAIPTADSLASAGKIVEALESLSNLEKLTRLGSDMKSNARIVQHMVKMCFDGKKWDLLNETILTLSKKRMIIKVAIAKMVKDACTMVEKLPTEDLKMKLIDTLRTVTAGKIYVEVERARLTSLVVKKLEAEGKVDEAATMLLELQVETYGSMEVKEKVEFLLEQMRISVARSDYVRAGIISKKISIKFFNSELPEVQDLKLKYYNLMITIGLQESQYLEVCRHYRAIFDTPIIKADPEKARAALKCAVVYCLLSPHSNEQWDLLHRIHIQRDLEPVVEYKALLDLFVNQELISWAGNIVAQYEKLLKKGTPTSPATPVFDSSSKDGEKRWEDFHLRVGEHNMRMVAKYYSEITFERLSELLDFPLDKMESFLCNLIVTGQIPDAKIHRPSRIVNLRARKAPIEELDQWASSVHKLTETLNKVSHLILKEQMVHKNLDISQY